MATKNAVLNYEQQFYLAGIPLSGVTSLDGSYSIEENPINIIGKGYTYPVRQGAMVGNFNIQKYYIGEDPLLNYTGDAPISGSINFNGSSFGFESGYLTEYSMSAGIGQIPESSASIVVYGDIGAGIDAYGTQSHPEIQIPNQGSISLNAAGYQSNRITSFSYTMRVDRTPIYKIGSPYPVQVDRSFPLLQEASFSIEVDDYEVARMREYLLKPKQQKIIIEFSNPINSAKIESFEINKARLLAQSINSSSDDMLSVNLTYRGYINKK
ncbi:MAG: hypothetical protein EBY39_08775 [Flavobacteriia bacterium]|nr:hypothetical protein [Flavobacteriia bacterium]